MNYSGGVNAETYRQMRNVSLLVAVVTAVFVLMVYFLGYASLVPLVGSAFKAPYEALSPATPVLGGVGGAAVLVFLLASAMSGLSLTDLKMLG